MNYNLQYNAKVLKILLAVSSDCKSELDLLVKVGVCVIFYEVHSISVSVLTHLRSGPK